MGEFIFKSAIELADLIQFAKLVADFTPGFVKPEGY